MARWIEILSAYSFEIEHRPGIKHQNADALSRYPKSGPDENNHLRCGPCNKCTKRALEIQSDLSWQYRKTGMGYGGLSSEPQQKECSHCYTNVSCGHLIIYVWTYFLPMLFRKDAEKLLYDTRERYINDHKETGKWSWTHSTDR